MKDQLQKPAYDARQKYVELLIKRLELSGDYLNQGNLQQSYLELQQVYRLVKPWIQPASAQALDRSLRTAEQHIKEKRLHGRGYPWADLSRQRMNKKAEHELLIITGELTTAAKHMMLPSSVEEQYGDVDIESVRGQFT